MNYIGIDPSFTRAGIAVITEDNNIILNRATVDIGDKTFQNIFKASMRQTYNILLIVKQYIKDSMVILEEPFSGSSFSSGLFALDSILNNNIINQRPKAIYNMHPSYLRYIFKTRKANKTESVNLANSIIDIFTKHGFTIENSKKMCHDEAEAFILASRLYVSINSNQITEEIINLNNRMNDVKEKLLFLDGKLY